jgi:hypothetical protein
MIVVATVGLLSAMALPHFLSARDRADAKPRLAGLVGISKESSTFNAEVDMTSSTFAGPIYTVICGSSSQSSVTMSIRS